MLVSGGSGVTYALSTAQELMQKSAECASRTRVVELVWSITDPGMYPLPFQNVRSLMYQRNVLSRPEASPPAIHPAPRR